MLAVLPKRSQDDVSGELVGAAYQRKLAHLPNAAISFVADNAMEQCHWFPTIAECLDIAKAYYRRDDATQRRAWAEQISRNEKRLRYQDELASRKREDSEELTQDDVDGMTDVLHRIGVANGWLTIDANGRHVLSPRAR